jgi:hypothetical protein
LTTEEENTRFILNFGNHLPDDLTSQKASISNCIAARISKRTRNTRFGNETFNSYVGIAPYLQMPTKLTSTHNITEYIGCKHSTVLGILLEITLKGFE